MILVLAVVLLAILKLWPGGLWLVLGIAALLVAGVLYWQNRAEKELALARITVTYDAAHCPAGRPLSVTIRNDASTTLDRVQFTLHASIPGYSGEVTPYTYRLLDSARILEPGESYAACYPVPVLSRAAAEAPVADLEWSGRAAKVWFR